MRPRRIAALVACALLLGACAAGAGSAEENRPRPSIDFPSSVPAGSVQTATLTVTNPGPEAFDSLLVAFSRLGRAPDKPVVPEPIVDTGFKGRNRAVVSVIPKPVAVSQDGLVYRFGSLGPGRDMEVEFSLRMPQRPGLAANAVIVSDGSNLKLSRGVTLETSVRG
jgi:hypothetical protein